MSLPTLQDAKDYLRIQTLAENVVVTALLARAQAMVETYLGVRITAAEETVTDHTERSARAYARVTTLQLPRYPFAATNPAPVVVDAQGQTVDPATYTLEPRFGQLLGNPGVSFDNGPYAITATVGLSAHPDYATRIEPLVSAAILDLVADLYQRRNPAASNESEGGVSVTYRPDVIPMRTQAYLASCRMVGVAG